jgi:hypothetical protein
MATFDAEPALNLKPYATVSISPTRKISPPCQSSEFRRFNMLICSITAQPTAVTGLAATVALGEPLFDLGELVVTPNALTAIATAKQIPDALITRHLAGDWSEMAEEDRATNRDAIQLGRRIFSSYKLATGSRIWIITEADRSVTTVLLPLEY